MVWELLFQRKFFPSGSQTRESHNMYSYGVEGIVFSDTVDTSNYNFQAGSTSFTWENVKVNLFDKVTVQVSVQEAGEGGAQRSKLVLGLLKPSIPGFSIQDAKEETPRAKKIKTDR